MATRDENFPELSEKSPHIADRTWDSVSILSKPIRFGTVAWSTSNPRFHIIDAIDIYARLFTTYNNSRIARLLKTFRYLRSGFRFKVQLTSTKFNSGKLKAVYFPPTFFRSSTISDYETYTVHRLLSMPGVELSASAPGSIDVICPFSACLPNYTMQRYFSAGNGTRGATTDLYGWGTLVLFVLSPLQTPDCVNATADVNTWFQLEEPKLAVPTRPAFNNIPLDQEPTSAFEIQNAIDSLTSKLRDLRDCVEMDVNNLQDVYTHNNSLIHGTSDKPVVLGHHPSKISGITNVVTKDTAGKLSDLFSREGYLTNTQWNSTAVSNTVLFNFTVAPKPFFATPANVSYSTPLSYLSQPFAYWRGGIRFRFSIVKTQFMQGRLQFFYSPGSDVVTVDDQSELYTGTIDISECSDFIVEIPFMFHKDWCTNGPKTNAFSSDNTHGSFVMRVLNRLTTNDCTISSADILCYTSACSNFQVANLRPFSYADTLSGVELAAALSGLNSIPFPAADETKDGRDDVQSLVETTLPSTKYDASREPIVLGVGYPFTLSSFHMNMDVFSSLDDLLHRPIRYLTWTSSLGGSDHDTLRIPMSTRGIVTSNNNEAPFLHSDLVFHYQNCFRYFTGGFVFTCVNSLKAASSASSSVVDPVFVSYRYNENKYIGTDADGLAAPLTYYPTTSFNLNTRPLFVFQVPLVSQNSALMCDYSSYGRNTGPVQGTFPLQENIQAGHVSIRNRFHEDFDCVIYRSTAPDFNFHFYVGVPSGDDLVTMFFNQIVALVGAGEWNEIMSILMGMEDISDLINNSPAAGNSSFCVLLKTQIGNTVTANWINARLVDTGIDDGTTVRLLFGLPP